MKTDLHMHSKFSDGKQWPEEIVALAKTMNFEMLALTDHDTMAGVKRFLKACSKHGIKGIPAVEIDYDVKQIHYNSELLGYFPEGKYAMTHAILNDLQNMRRTIAIEAISIVAIEHKRNDLSFNDLLRHKLNEPLLNPEDLNISITKPICIIISLIKILQLDMLKKIIQPLKRNSLIVLFLPKSAVQNQD